MTSTFTSYSLIAKDLTAALARKAAEPVVARETAYYEAHIGAVTSIDDLLGNQRLYRYAMKAYGLEDMTYAKAFMRKVLTEGVTDATSFANRLSDDRYVAFAKAFDFDTNGTATTSLDAAQGETTAAYMRQSLESDAGDADTGVRLALYFARMAPNLTSAYQILGDTALTQVANTVLGLPTDSSAASTEALKRKAETIAEKIDLDSFREPAKLDAFLKRFTAVWDAQNSTETAPVLALFDTASASEGLSADLLLSLQQIRLGS